MLHFIYCFHRLTSDKHMFPKDSRLLPFPWVAAFSLKKEKEVNLIADRSENRSMQGTNHGDLESKRYWMFYTVSVPWSFVFWRLNYLPRVTWRLHPSILKPCKPQAESSHEKSASRDVRIHNNPHKFSALMGIFWKSRWRSHSLDSHFTVQKSR